MDFEDDSALTTFDEVFGEGFFLLLLPVLCVLSILDDEDVAVPVRDLFLSFPTGAPPSPAFSPFDDLEEGGLGVPEESEFETDGSSTISSHESTGSFPAEALLPDWLVTLDERGGALESTGGHKGGWVC